MLADARHYIMFFASVDYNLNKNVNAIGNFNLLLKKKFCLVSFCIDECISPFVYNGSTSTIQNYMT